MELSKTILGFPYREDDRVLNITNFVAEYLNNPNVEIEAKLGYFKSHENGFNVLHIQEFDPQKTGARFESSLQPLMFFSLLDSLKLACKEVTYTETEDHLYTCPGRDSKIRQTVNCNSEIIAIIKKTKIADKNFLLNCSGTGIRISANYEETLSEIPENSKFSIMRKKKRHAFRYQYLEVDLTEVSMNNKLTYEVEIEIVDFEFVKKHVENFVIGREKGVLVGICRKIWQNALSLSFHKPRASVVKVEENRQIMEERELAYQMHYGVTRPAIGDYLYCCALEKNNAEMVV